MGVRKRKIEIDYLKVNGEFTVLNVGFTELNESPSAQTASKRYIHQSSASQTVTGYEGQHSFNTDQMESNEAIEYINHIGKMRLTGADAETEYIIVEKDRPSSEGANYFYARKFNVAIAVDSFDDNDGELATSGNFLDQGDPIEGTFNTVTKVFTPGFSALTLEVSYEATGAISEISVSGITYDSVNDKFIGIPSYITSFTFKDGTTTKTATLGSSWTVA